MTLKPKNLKVYKNKKLNAANFDDFNHNDYQVFLHLVSKIGGVDEVGRYLQPDKLQREHVLTAKEFSEVFNTDIHNSYGLLNRACKKLMKTDLTLSRNESSELWQINVCSMAKYNQKEGSISIKFTDDIMPYLAQVRQKFLLYNLKEIANFGSIYTTRLYELIQEFKDTGYMIKSIEQLRKAFAVGEKLKKYNHLKTKTFEHACQEINDNYKMNLGFEEIKEGRKVVAIKFVFKKTRLRTVYNQRSGKMVNVYEKPQKVEDEEIKEPDIKESSNSTKSLGNVFDELLENIKNK